ncbi:MAG: hypothetical protein ABIE84_02450 [bacterium]
MTIVRLVQPSTQPALPKVTTDPLRSVKKSFSKTVDFILGSGTGLFAGLAILLLLKLMGINFDSLESSLIVGLPSVVGVFTSLVIY